MRRFSSQNGSTIVLGLIATLALSLTASVVFGYFLNLQQQQNRQSLLNTTGQIQANIFNAISSDSAWDETKTNNAVPTAVPSLFKLYDGSGVIIYDSTNPNSGFTNGGTACSNWAIGGSPNCPLRLDLSWQQVGTCNGVVAPAYQISGIYNYQAGSTARPMTINWQNYSNQLFFGRPVAIQTFSCIGGPPAGACNAPDQWYCTSTGWSCGRIYN